MQDNTPRGRRTTRDHSVCPEVDTTARQDPEPVEALIEAYAPLVKYIAQRRSHGQAEWSTRKSHTSAISANW